MLVEYGSVFMILAVVLGFYMTWGIGANDVANAMGTSVGSGAISVKQAIIIAAIFEFSGAFLAGGHVTKTIRKSIIDPTPIMDQPEILVWGMLSAMLAAALWLTFASWMGWPVSTTHSIIGAIVGFAVVGIGVDAVNWSKIGTIVLSWIVSPLVGGTLAYLLMRSIQKFILDSDTPFLNAKLYAPVYVFLVGFLLSLVTLFKGLKHLDITFSVGQSVFAAVIFGVLLAVIVSFMINRLKMKEAESIHDQFTQIEKIFGIMMIFTACAMAFAHGSNDVANGIGPMAAIVSIVESGGEMAQKSNLPLWILLSGMLEKIPHRGYTDGSLNNEADAESVYKGERNGRNSGYEIAGTVMEVEDGKSFTMLTHNSFDRNKTLEILTFDGGVIYISTQEMKDLNNKPVKRANPSRLFRFACSEAAEQSADVSGISQVQPLNVVRLKI